MGIPEKKAFNYSAKVQTLSSIAVNPLSGDAISDESILDFFTVSARICALGGSDVWSETTDSGSRSVFRYAQASRIGFVPVEFCIGIFADAFLPVDYVSQHYQ